MGMVREEEEEEAKKGEFSFLTVGRQVGERHTQVVSRFRKAGYH